jgi:CubicO group peptidase (beta-lactamase class C family)
MVAQHDQVIWRGAYGLADRGKQRVATADTSFRIGSVTKQFTATAILQLAAAGKVSLRSSLATYLPDYPNHELASKVTLRQLLNHTSGAGDIFGDEFDAHRLELKTHADYLKLLGTRGPQFDPGTQDRYSNYGFVLLGAVIERVSGMSYYDYVDQFVFKRAGMRASGSPPESQQIAARATGYTKVNDVLTDAKDTMPYRGMAAGGGCSTARDLFHFARALQAGALIPEDLLREAISPQNNGRWYGYGFMVSGEGSLQNYGHEGGAPGMNGILRVYPELDVVVIALSNLDPPAADQLADFYAERMPL